MSRSWETCQKEIDAAVVIIVAVAVADSIIADVVDLTIVGAVDLITAEVVDLVAVVDGHYYGYCY